MIKFKWETKFKKTEIGEIPRDWEINEIGEVITQIEKGKVPEKFPGIYPYLSVDYLRGNLNNTEFYDKKAGVFVTKDDILIIWDGVINAGEIFRGREGLLSSTMCRLEYDKVKIEREYFYHALKLLEPIIREARRGTDDRHVDKNMFLGLKIPYPPPEEQSRIATVLSWFDDLIENKKRQNEILEKVAMAIFKSWFVDFEPFKDEEFVYSEELGKEIPKGWEVKAIGEVAEFVKGLSYRSNELVDNLTEGEIFITLKIFKRGGGFRPEYKYYRGNRYSDEQVVYDGDLVIALTDMTSDAKVVGAPALVILPPYKDKGILSLDAAKLNVPQYMKEYAYLYLKDSQEENSTFANGVNVLHLNLNLFKIGKLILIPPQPILQHFHSLVEPLFQKIILNQRQIMVLWKIRDALLPKLVFGKLRVVEI